MIAIDNDIVGLFFNGAEITSLVEHEGCPYWDDYTFDVPQNLIATGNNMLAAHLRDRGVDSFFDARILGEAIEWPCAEFALGILDIDLRERETGADGYTLGGTLVLDEGSDGLDFFMDPIKIEVGPSEVTIPAGSLQSDGLTYSWDGEIDGVEVAANFDDEGDDTFSFKIDVRPVDLTGSCTLVSASLTLGNDACTTTEFLGGRLHLVEDDEDEDEDDDGGATTNIFERNWNLPSDGTVHLGPGG
jgi:hypothetical protein